jgi:hypothetical protein
MPGEDYAERGGTGGIPLFDVEKPKAFSWQLLIRGILKGSISPLSIRTKFLRQHQSVRFYYVAKLRFASRVKNLKSLAFGSWRKNFVLSWGNPPNPCIYN